MNLNRFVEAETQIKIAEALDPMDPWVLSFGAVVYFVQGKVLSAFKRYEQLRKLEPNHPMLNEYLLAKYANTGQHNLAIEQLKIFALDKVNDHNLLKLIDSSYQNYGFKAAVKFVAVELEEMGTSTFVAPSSILRLYELLGDQDKRLIWLQKMHEIKDPILPYYGIRTDDPIQNTPTYIKIMQDINLW